MDASFLRIVTRDLGRNFFAAKDDRACIDKSQPVLESDECCKSFLYSLLRQFLSTATRQLLFSLIFGQILALQKNGSER